MGSAGSSRPKIRRCVCSRSPITICCWPSNRPPKTTPVTTSVRPRDGGAVIPLSDSSVQFDPSHTELQVCRSLHIERVAKLLTFSLGEYHKKVDADYFRAKYPDLPADAVVDVRIQLAARYASIAGGLTAAAYTGAVAATIGSGGGASPLTLPAGGVSFVVDLVFLSQLQLRLAHDIAVLYRVPLDPNDPDDLWKLIRIAFTVRSGEVGSNALPKGHRRSCDRS